MLFYRVGLDVVARDPSEMALNRPRYLKHRISEQYDNAIEVEA